MADGIGHVRRFDMLKWLTGNTATAPSGFSFACWNGTDPGDDGQSGAEVAPTGYSRPSTSGTGSGTWTCTDGGNDVDTTAKNAAAIAFGTWTTGPTTVGYVTIWTTTGTTAANFIARCAVSGAPSVNAGATVSIAINGLTLAVQP